MNTSNKNTSNYKTNSRGKRGGLSGNNYKSDGLNNKQKNINQVDCKDSESNRDSLNFSSTNIDTNKNNLSSINYQSNKSNPNSQHSSPQNKKLVSSKKVHIDYDKLPDLNTSTQKAVDISLNESKGDIIADFSMVSANNDNDKINLSMENFEANKTMEMEKGNEQINYNLFPKDRENVINDIDQIEKSQSSRKQSLFSANEKIESEIKESNKDENNNKEKENFEKDYIKENEEGIYKYI